MKLLWNKDVKNNNLQMYFHRWPNSKRGNKREWCSKT